MPRHVCCWVLVSRLLAYRRCEAGVHEFWKRLVINGSEQLDSAGALTCSGPRSTRSWLKVTACSAGSGDGAVAWSTGLLGVPAGSLIAMITTPVGVSGAVFLLPIQLSVLGVPSPAVTPTNLLFNVVAGPGALLRYRRNGHLASPLTRQLILGTLPGVVLGALIRVLAVPGPRVFRLIVAVLLLPIGAWLIGRTLRPARNEPGKGLSKKVTVVLALAVGVIGGIYGVGGGSILGPLLVSRGIPVAMVAPAALAATFLTSIAGALSYTILSLITSGDIAPDWTLGLLCGLGGLAGGYLGAYLQPHLPERALRLLLGTLAVALAVLYLSQALG